MKRKLFTLSLICAFCMAIGITSVTDITANVAAAESSSKLSQTKIMRSNNNDKMLLATGVKDVETVYEVGYTLSASEGEVTTLKAETNKYYQAITSGDTTWTAETIFGDSSYEGIIVWEIDFDLGISYTIEAYAKYGEAVEGGIDITNSVTETATERVCAYYQVILDNGEEQTSIVVAAGTSAELLYSEAYLPVNDGMVFDGWYNGATKIQETDIISENLTLTAKFWTKDYFEVMGFSAEELGEGSIEFVPLSMKYAVSYCNTIDGASEEDNAKVDGSLLKLKTSNGYTWGSDIKTTFNGAIDAAFEATGFDYVDIRLYVTYEYNKYPLCFKVKSTNVDLLVSSTVGWKTVRIPRTVWESATDKLLQIALPNTDAQKCEFTVYFDSIKGGYNKENISGSQHFENTNGISFGHSSALTYNESYEIVDTISGAPEEDLAQVQGSMLKLSFANGMAASTSKQTGIWSNFGKDYIDALRTDSNTEYIVLKFYVQFNGELPETDTVKAYIAYGINPGQVYYAGDHAINLNESAWYTLKVPVGTWNANVGNGTHGWFFYSKNNVDVTFYFDEMYAIDANNDMVTLVDSINLVEKTGLTAEQLAGTYVMNGQEKVELTAEQLVAYTPVAGQEIVIVVNVDGYKQSEFVLKVS